MNGATVHERGCSLISWSPIVSEIHLATCSNLSGSLSVRDRERNCRDQRNKVMSDSGDLSFWKNTVNTLDVLVFAASSG